MIQDFIEVCCISILLDAFKRFLAGRDNVVLLSFICDFTTSKIATSPTTSWLEPCTTFATFRICVLLYSSS